MTTIRIDKSAARAQYEAMLQAEKASGEVKPSLPEISSLSKAMDSFVERVDMLVEVKSQLETLLEADCKRVELIIRKMEANDELMAGEFRRAFHRATKAVVESMDTAGEKPGVGTGEVSC